MDKDLRKRAEAFARHMKERDDALQAAIQKAEEAQERAEKNGAFLLEIAETLGETTLLRTKMTSLLERIREVKKR